MPNSEKRVLMAVTVRGYGGSDTELTKEVAEGLGLRGVRCVVAECIGDPRGEVQLLEQERNLAMDEAHRLRCQLKAMDKKY